MGNESLAVQLSAVVASTTATEISINYALKNTTNARIVVFDHYVYFGEKSVAHRDPGGVNVFLDADGSARLVRGVFSPPIYMAVASRPPILVSPVEPGASLTGVIRLAVPTAESNIFFPRISCDVANARRIKHVRLQLGWLEHGSNMTFRELVIDDKKFFNIGSDWGQPVQRVAEVNIAGLSILVCPYPGRFDGPLLTK